MKGKEIASRHNPTFRKFTKLLSGQGVKKYGLTLISGPKQVTEILRDFPGRCDGIILEKDQDVPEGMLSESITRYDLTSDLFREVDVYGTKQPILSVRVDPFPVWTATQWPPGCTLFVPFQDPVNVGAVIRTAAAFGVARLVLLKEAAHPFHHKSTRVAGSTLFRVPIFQGSSIRELRETEIPIITLSPEGKDITRYRFPQTFGLLPGLEGPGIPPEVRHLRALSIPMAPGVQSLNAAMATGIALYVWQSRVRGSR